MKPIDYLIENKLAIIKNKYFYYMVGSSDIPSNYKVLNEDYLSNDECKIYLCTFIHYLNKYNLLPYFSFKLDEKVNKEYSGFGVYKIRYFYDENCCDLNISGDKISETISFLNDIMEILLPNMAPSNISYLADGLLYDLD